MTNHPRLQRKQEQFHSDLWILIASIFLFLWVLLWGIGLIQEASADPQPQVTAFESREQTQFQKVVYDLPQETTIIGCFNSLTMETREPNDGTCYGFGNSGWHNISLPPQWHFPKWREFWSEGGVINRLVIVNFESNFNPEAWNPYAHWYVQTLRSYNIAPDVTSQLSWMAYRETHNTGKRCAEFLHRDYIKGNAKAGQSGYISCIARWHYGFFSDPSNKHYHTSLFYAKRANIVRQYYEDYFSSY